MDTSKSLVRTELTGLVFVLAIACAQVVHSAQDGAETSAPAEDAPTDPIVPFCQNGSHGRFYDCACLGESAPPFRAAWSEQMGERHRSQLSSAPTPEKISRWEEELEDDTKSEREVIRLRMKIESAKRTVERLESTPPPGPMAMPLPNLFNELARERICRAGDELEKDRYRACMQGFRYRIEIDSEREDFCQCVGQTVAEKWVSGETILHSQAISAATGRAYTSCFDEQ